MKDQHAPRTFRLVGGRCEVIAEAITDVRWRILRCTGAIDNFLRGDQVASTTLIPWRQAKERVGVRRTRVNPKERLVLLKGVEEKHKSEEEINALLAYLAGTGPFPQPPEPAA